MGPLIYNPQIGAYINFDIKTILKQKQLRKNYALRKGFYPYNYNFVLGFRGEVAQCYICGNFVLMKEMTRDHTYPKSLGGVITSTSCNRCNSKKRNLRSIEWAIESLNHDFVYDRYY